MLLQLGIYLLACKILLRCCILCSNISYLIWAYPIIRFYHELQGGRDPYGYETPQQLGLRNTLLNYILIYIDQRFNCLPEEAEFEVRPLICNYYSYNNVNRFSASEVTTIWRYTNVYIIIIIMRSEIYNINHKAAIVSLVVLM